VVKVPETLASSTTFKPDNQVQQSPQVTAHELAKKQVEYQLNQERLRKQHEDDSVVIEAPYDHTLDV
jgi:hypothetical protein